MNQVIWIQADNTGGSIPAHILADGDTLFGSGNTVAIRHVRAWNTISGSIIATDKGIGEVRVVGSSSSSPGGIQGDIIAAQGSIAQIWSSGQIGSSTNTVAITAGKRIGRISCRDDATPTNDSSEILAKPVYANIEASALGTAPGGTESDSSLSLIETGGDFVGDLHLYQFSAVTTQPYARVSGRHGIFVGGKFDGDITVDFDYSHADMIARSFRGTITVGKFFEGCIVAVGHSTPTDSLDGTIGAISIGNNGIDAEFGENLHGFSGKYRPHIAQPPFEGSYRDNWYTMQTYSGDDDDHGMVDSVIRADKSIDSVDIKAMSGRLYAGTTAD